MPVFHAKRDVRTSAVCPNAVEARSSPERMSVTSAHAPSENTRSGARFVAAATSRASAFVGDHIRLDNKLPCMRFGPGSKGAAEANVECRKLLTIESDPSADVKIGINGIMKQATAEK